MLRRRAGLKRNGRILTSNGTSLGLPINRLFRVFNSASEFMHEIIKFSRAIIIPFTADISALMTTKVGGFQTLGQLITLAMVIVVICVFSCVPARIQK